MHRGVIITVIIIIIKHAETAFMVMRCRPGKPTGDDDYDGWRKRKKKKWKIDDEEERSLLGSLLRSEKRIRGVAIKRRDYRTSDEINGSVTSRYDYCPWIDYSAKPYLLGPI